MTLPSAIWLCPVHHDEFTVPHGGVCPAPGCHEDLVEYFRIDQGRKYTFHLHIDGNEIARALARSPETVARRRPSAGDYLTAALALLRQTSHLLHNLPAIPQRDERALLQRIDAFLERSTES